MNARWRMFWLIFTAIGWLMSGTLTVAAAAAGDYGRAGYNLALTLVNAVSFAVFWLLGDEPR